MNKAFKFTPEQLKAIYDGDIDARNAFFFDNLDIITRMAQCAYDREKHATVTVEDLIQGAYVDMDYFRRGVNNPVVDEVGIRGFLRWSFHLAPYGGLAHCREYNPKITSKCAFFDPQYCDNNFVRLDALMRENSEKRGTVAFEEYLYTDDGDDDFAELGVIDGDDNEQSEDYTAEYVEVFGEYLTPKMRDVFALTMDGYDVTHIAEKLGLKLGATTTRQVRIREAFGKHLDEVVKDLAERGINADGIVDRQPKRFYKMSEEQRAYHRENARKNRARRRAERKDHDDIS